MLLMSEGGIPPAGCRSSAYIIRGLLYGLQTDLKTRLYEADGSGRGARGHTPIRFRLTCRYALTGHCAPFRGRAGGPRATNEVVARRKVRHVHPLGALQRPGQARVGDGE